MIETIGYWRRYCQLHDCIGDARPDADVGVGVHAPVMPVAPLRDIVANITTGTARLVSTPATTTPNPRTALHRSGVVSLVPKARTVPIGHHVSASAQGLSVRPD